MLTIGSLFSGIGGLELGLEMAGLGPTLWQVEQAKFAQCVLRHHWPEARLFDDVRTVGSDCLSRVDLICGGFPCQDVSSAGTRAGLAGSRSGLWREYARIVAELQPAWVVVENVTSGASQWLDAIVRELDALGYDCLPCPVSARDVGAPHRRERLFVVAHANGEFLREERRRRGAGAAAAFAGEFGQARGTSDDDRVVGIPREGDARKECSGRPIAARGADADSTESRRAGTGRELLGQQSASFAWRSPEPGVVPLVHGLSGGMAGRRRRARIRALGNAVVPQCGEVVGWVVRELAGLTEVS